MMIVLGVILPLIFARPTLASVSTLPVVLAWVITLFASAQLCALMLTGRERIISLTFWLFIYVWLGIGALANVVSQQFPLFGQTYHGGTEVAALVTILVGLVGYEFGRRQVRATRFTGQSIDGLNGPTVSLGRVRIVGVIGVAVVLYFTAKYGFAIRFSSRAAETSAFFGTNVSQNVLQVADKTGGSVRVSLDWMLAFLALYVVLYDHRIQRSKQQEADGRRSRMRYPVLVWGLIAAVVLADNPISSPRDRFGGVAIALLLAAWPMRSPTRFRIFAAGLIVAALFIYPYAALFRNSSPVLHLAPLNTQFRTSADFSMFQQELNAQTYVQAHGHSWGRALEGAALVWIPRSLWPGKPGATGSMIVPTYEAGIFPTSLSIFGWAFVDGGMVWVFVVLCAYGWSTGKLERSYLARPPNRLTLATVGAPLFAAFQVFLLRGDLQPAVGQLLPLAVAVVVVCKWRRRVRPVASPRRTPTVKGSFPELPGAALARDDAQARRGANGNDCEAALAYSRELLDSGVSEGIAFAALLSVHNDHVRLNIGTGGASIRYAARRPTTAAHRLVRRATTGWRRRLRKLDRCKELPVLMAVRALEGRAGEDLHRQAERHLKICEACAASDEHFRAMMRLRNGQLLGD